MFCLNLLKIARQHQAAQPVQLLLCRLEVLHQSTTAVAITCTPLAALQGRVFVLAAATNDGSCSVRLKSLKKQEEAGTEKSQFCLWEGVSISLHFNLSVGPVLLVL